MRWQGTPARAKGTAAATPVYGGASLPAQHYPTTYPGGTEYAPISQEPAHISPGGRVNGAPVFNPRGRSSAASRVPIPVKEGTVNPKHNGTPYRGPQSGVTPWHQGADAAGTRQPRVARVASALKG